jgi:hypothetical protein
VVAVSEARLRLREGVLAQLELPRAVLLDARSGEYFELDPVATVLVRALVAEGTARAAVAALCAAFEVDAARAARDVEGFIGDLRARGLVVADGG